MSHIKSQCWVANEFYHLWGPGCWTLPQQSRALCPGDAVWLRCPLVVWVLLLSLGEMPWSSGFTVHWKAWLLEVRIWARGESLLVVAAGFRGSAPAPSFPPWPAPCAPALAAPDGGGVWGHFLSLIRSVALALPRGLSARQSISKGSHIGRVPQPKEGPPSYVTV